MDNSLVTLTSAVKIFNLKFFLKKRSFYEFQRRVSPSKKSSSSSSRWVVPVWLQTVSLRSVGYSTTTKGNLTIHLQSDKHSNNVRVLQAAGKLPKRITVMPESQLQPRTVSRILFTHFKYFQLMISIKTMWLYNLRYIDYHANQFNGWGVSYFALFVVATETYSTLHF